MVVGGADAIEEALLHLDRGLEFYQLNVNSKVGILTGLVQILKKGRTFRSWVQDNVRNGMVQKKKVNAIILKSRKERAAIKNKEKEDRKRDRVTAGLSVALTNKLNSLAFPLGVNPRTTL